MLTRLSHLFHRNAKGWLIVVLAILDFLFMGVIMPRIQASLEALSGGVGPIDLRFFSTPAQIQTMVEAYGEAGRASYRLVELTADILYPIVYTLFFGLLLSWLLQRAFASGSSARRLNVVPLAAWLFDLLENLGIVTLLSIYPNTSTLLAWATILFTVIKWVFALVTLVLIIFALVLAIRNRFRKQ
jgi:hypothetical protein